jgi:hypothetical protein
MSMGLCNTPSIHQRRVIHALQELLGRICHIYLDNIIIWATDINSQVPIFVKKKNATLEHCIEILNWYHKNNKDQLVTAKHFATIYPNLQIKQPIILKWMKNEAKIQKQWEQINHQSDCTAKQV